MAIFAGLRQIRCCTHSQAIVPTLLRSSRSVPIAPVLFSRTLITGHLPVAYSEELLPPLPAKVKKPRRKWVSVADLVVEVEQALVSGSRLDKDGATFNNLDSEKERLRGDNDRLYEKCRELKEARAKHVANEESIAEKLMGDGGSHLREILLEHVDTSRAIKKIDMELSALRSQNKQNIQDIGLLKFTKVRIQNMGIESSLVDRVELSLKEGELLALDGPEAKALDERILLLQDEYDRVVPKFKSYAISRSQVRDELSDLESKLKAKLSDDPTLPHYVQDLDSIRHKIIEKVREDKRMLAQLDRLRQLQLMNTASIGMLERARAKLIRHASIKRLLEAGDTDAINAKVKVLNGDLEKLRTSIKDIECRLDAHAEEGQALVDRLRHKADTFNAEAGKEREVLFANIHQEEQWKARLAVLRTEKMQKLRFICTLQDALSKTFPTPF